MPRSKKEIETLCADLKRWYKEEFGVEYIHGCLDKSIGETLQKRLQAFVLKRLGHLPDMDLVAAIEELKKIPIAPVVEIKREVVNASLEKEGRGRRPK